MLVPKIKGSVVCRIFLLACVLCIALASPAWGHFGMIIPSASMVMEQADGDVTLELSFSHPMAGQGMSMEKPKSFQVVFAQGRQDLTAGLKPVQLMGSDAWSLQYTVSRPGVYQFLTEPKAYWEEAEDCFIIHYVKTFVAAFGAEDGWAAPAGIRTEIVPLTRPFGNYAGNVFQGQVLLDGKPVPGVEVEVEFYNRGGRHAAPNDYFVTQALRADANGVFTCGIPFAGWWGFAALSAAPETMDHEGEPKAVELGAVLWAEFLAPVSK